MWNIRKFFSKIIWKKAENKNLSISIFVRRLFQKVAFIIGLVIATVAADIGLVLRDGYDYTPPAKGYDYPPPGLF